MTARTMATMARMTGKDDDVVKDHNSEDDGDDGKDDKAKTTMTERAMTARTTATMTMARTTKMMAATVTAVAVVVARSVGRLVGWQGLWRGWGLRLVAWRLHTVGIVQTCFGI